LGPGGEELLAVMCKGFAMPILHLLTRLAKNNTAGADVIRDRACYSFAPRLAGWVDFPAPGPQRSKKHRRAHYANA
jgi:hypothetical protein